MHTERWEHCFWYLQGLYWWLCCGFSLHQCFTTWREDNKAISTRGLFFVPQGDGVSLDSCNPQSAGLSWYLMNQGGESKMWCKPYPSNHSNHASTVPVAWTILVWADVWLELSRAGGLKLMQTRKKSALEKRWVWDGFCLLETKDRISAFYRACLC